MSFESDLYSALMASAGLTALVSDRVEPSHASKGATPPYVVYTPIFNDERYDLDGPGGLAHVRLQVDCYAEDADAAAAIARAVIAAVPSTGWPLHKTAHSNQDLGLEAETRLYRRLVELSIVHRST